MSDLTFEHYFTDDGILVVKLKGGLDGASADEFRGQVGELMDEGATKLIIDCAHLGYVSSYGLGILIALKSSLKKRGGDVKLSAVHGIVADVIKAVQLGRLMDIYGDIEFAREAFSA